jgi:diguanylate cyclase (GGDEF)-like protein/PAS domain S-box-containing protein
MLSLVSVKDKDSGTPIELRMIAADGWRLMEVIGAPLADATIALSIRDLTDRRRWEVAGDEVATFRSLVQNSPNLTMLLASDGTVVSVSAAISRLLGRDPEHVCGQPVTCLVEERDRALVDAALEEAIACGASSSAPVRVEAMLQSADARGVAYELAIVSLIDDPTVGGLLVAAHDISRLRSAQDALVELAHIDSLTGIPNRRSFEAVLEREWLLTSRDGIDSYLVVADLDRFKELNDRWGHPAGDEALRDFADALRLAVRDTDIVARLGGDEFGVILVRCGGEPSAIGFEARLRDVLDRRVTMRPRDLTVSLGYASLRRSASAADAFAHADAAMFRTKRARRCANDEVQ